MCEWLPTIVGTLLGTAGALSVAVGAWSLKRRRVRNAVALVLFFEVKFLRTDWLSAVEKANVPDWIPGLLASWRGLQDVGADLFPRALVRRLTEVALTIDRVVTKSVSPTVPEGVDDLKAMVARCERDLAQLANESFDAATAEWLTTHEEQFGNLP
jgi:hypothetical protein